MKQLNFHIITYLLCPYVQRSIIILEEKGIPYTRTDIDLNNKPIWFKQKSPLGKVPILIINENKTLFESSVICEYLDEITAGTLHPIDNFEKAYHRSWIAFGSSILNNIANLYYAKEQTSFEIMHKQIKTMFKQLEQELTGTSYFTGDNISMIDAVYAPIFRYFDVFDSFTQLNTFDELPKCQLWRKQLKQQTSVIKAVSNDYPQRLITFLKARDSYISQLIFKNTNTYIEAPDLLTKEI